MSRKNSERRRRIRHTNFIEECSTDGWADYRQVSGVAEVVEVVELERKVRIQGDSLACRAGERVIGVREGAPAY